MPADHRSHLFPKRARHFVRGVDDYAQHRVAAAMLNLSMYEPPDYVLNVGDNFYWGGVNSTCNDNAFLTGFSWNQWGPIFEQMYRGGGLDGKQWLGVLGNHDYGGFKFNSGWHETIFYTWAGHHSESALLRLLHRLLLRGHQREQCVELQCIRSQRRAQHLQRVAQLARRVLHYRTCEPRCMPQLV